MGDEAALREAILTFAEPAGQVGMVWGVSMGGELAQDIIGRLRVYAEDGQAREITLRTDIRSLGIQSLELTEVIFDIEEAYGIEVEMNTVDAWAQLRTVGDVVSKVGALVAAKD